MAKTKTDEERAEINRQNASHSTGPRSPQGKAIVSRNAYKHGMRAEATALPGEDRQRLAALTDDWIRYYKPTSPGRRAMLDRAVYATVQLERGALFQTAVLTRQINEADELFLREQQEHVTFYKTQIDEDPEEAVRGLKETAAGCRYLLEEWAELNGFLEQAGSWESTGHRNRALRLLGMGPDDDTERVFWISLLNVLAMTSPTDKTLAWYKVRANVPITMQWLFREGYPGREQSRESLRAIVSGEMNLLMMREEMLRARIEEPARKGAPARALLLSDEDGARLIRYERMYDSMFHRSYKALLKDEDEASDEVPIQTGPLEDVAPIKANRVDEVAPIKANLEETATPIKANFVASTEANRTDPDAPIKANFVENLAPIKANFEVPTAAQTEAKLSEILRSYEVAASFEVPDGDRPIGSVAWLTGPSPLEGEVRWGVAS